MTTLAHNCAQRQLEIFESVLVMFGILYPCLVWASVDDYENHLRHELMMTSEFGPKIALPHENRDDYSEQVSVMLAETTIEKQLVAKAFCEASSHHRAEGCA